MSRRAAASGVRAPGSVVTLYHLNHTFEAHAPLMARRSPRLNAVTKRLINVRVSGTTTKLRWRGGEGRHCRQSQRGCHCDRCYDR